MPAAFFLIRIAETEIRPGRPAASGALRKLSRIQIRKESGRSSAVVKTGVSRLRRDENRNQTDN